MRISTCIENVFVKYFVCFSFVLFWQPKFQSNVNISSFNWLWVFCKTYTSSSLSHCVFWYVWFWNSNVCIYYNVNQWYKHMLTLKVKSAGDIGNVDWSSHLYRRLYYIAPRCKRHKVVGKCILPFGVWACHCGAYSVIKTTCYLNGVNPRIGHRLQCMFWIKLLYYCLMWQLSSKRYVDIRYCMSYFAIFRLSVSLTFDREV